MHLPLFSAFDHFEPFESVPNSSHPLAFRYVLKVAREILGKRTPTELRGGAILLDVLMAERDYITQRKIREGIIEPPHRDSPSQTLREALKHYAFESEVHGAFPNESKEEFFALLALAIVGLTCSVGLDPVTRLESMDFRQPRANYADSHAVDALEAIAWAEAIRESKEQLLDLEKAKRKLSAGATAKNQKYRRLQVRWISYYIDNRDQHPSDVKCMYAFYFALPEEDRILSVDRLEKTLGKWIQPIKSRNYKT